MKVLQGVLLMLLSQLSWASGSTGGNYIAAMGQRECTPGKGFQITLQEPHANPDGCSNPKVLELECSHPKHKTITSLAMTAMATGIKVSAWVKDCDNEGQAKIVSFSLIK